MPLSENNKQESKSIEDLIAQLESPLQNSNNHSKNNHSDEAVSNNELSNSNGSRKLLKGKRSNNNNNNNNNNCQPNSPNTATASSSFSKTNSFGHNSEPILCKNIIISKKYTKHMKSLNNRGLPKKNGAGGKHTWGAPGCELEDEYFDTKDPNYDSEQEENVVMVCVENNDQSKSKIANDDDEVESSKENLKELTLENMEREIKLLILEYFQNGDTVEVIDTLKCYNFSKIKPQLIAYFVQISLDHNNTSKELISRLLRDFIIELFVEKDFVNAFDLLLKNLSDLILDYPEAPEKISTFIARAIADKVITKNYLERFSNEQANPSIPDLNNEHINKAIESAKLLVNINNHLFQLSHIWGNKGGFLAVKELTDKINEIIQEYHDSGDVDEAIRCLKDLNVPHFHHEFIYEALDFSLQKTNDKAIDLIVNLLEKLSKSLIVTYDQLKIGFTRLFDLLPDISLDVPKANNLLDKILNQCHEKGFVNEDIMDLAPNRSRKRFVSEGDGGRIKENGL